MPKILTILSTILALTLLGAYGYSLKEPEVGPLSLLGNAVGKSYTPKPCKGPSKMIIIGGVDKDPNHPIFNWVKGGNKPNLISKLLTKKTNPSIINYPLPQNESLAEAKAKLQDMISGSGNCSCTTIVAFSLGSIIAFNLQKESPQSSCTSYLFIDPPYDHPKCKIPFASVFEETCKEINKAKEGGIADSPDTINWTNGTAKPPHHDPFSDPNNPINKENLKALRKAIDKAKKSCGGATVCKFPN